MGEERRRKGTYTDSQRHEIRQDFRDVHLRFWILMCHVLFLPRNFYNSYLVVEQLETW